MCCQKRTTCSNRLLFAVICNRIITITVPLMKVSPLLRVDLLLRFFVVVDWELLTCDGIVLSHDLFAAWDREARRCRSSTWPPWKPDSYVWQLASIFLITNIIPGQAETALTHVREGTKAVPEQLLLSKKKCFSVTLQPKALRILDALISRGKKEKKKWSECPPPHLFHVIAFPAALPLTAADHFCNPCQPHSETLQDRAALTAQGRPMRVTFPSSSTNQIRHYSHRRDFAFNQP